MSIRRDWAEGRELPIVLFTLIFPAFYQLVLMLPDPASGNFKRLTDLPVSINIHWLDSSN